MTIKEIIAACGGAAKIAARSAELGDSLTVDAVYKWQVNGIRWDRWRIILSLTDQVTASDIYAANEKLRREGRGPLALSPAAA